MIEVAIKQSPSQPFHYCDYNEVYIVCPSYTSMDILREVAGKIILVQLSYECDSIVCPIFTSKDI